MLQLPTHDRRLSTHLIQKYLERGLRRLSSRARNLPDLLIVGAMRSGTSALQTAVATHPEFVSPSRKEPHYFDLNYSRGIQWYRAFFPIAGGSMSVDATPSYLAHPDAAQRAHATVPAAKVLASLRDPVERAWSHYRYRASKGQESRSFDQVVSDEVDEKADPLSGFDRVGDVSIISAGVYAPQLKRWIDTYGEEAVHVIDANALFTDPDSEMARVQRFLGLSHPLSIERSNAAPSLCGSPSEWAIATLKDFYEEPNAELRRVCELDFSWT